MHFHKFARLLCCFLLFCGYFFLFWQLYSYQLPGHVLQIANNLEVLSSAPSTPTPLAPRPPGSLHPVSFLLGQKLIQVYSKTNLTFKSSASSGEKWEM